MHIYISSNQQEPGLSSTPQNLYGVFINLIYSSPTLSHSSTPLIIPTELTLNYHKQKAKSKLQYHLMQKALVYESL